MRALHFVGDRGAWVAVLSAITVAAACERQTHEAPPVYGTGAMGGSSVLGGGGSGGKGAGGKGGGPTFDDRPVVTAAVAPPPISGGTLLVLSAGGRAVVSDSDRDRVIVVDLTTLAVDVTFPLGAHAEPGRAVEDANGRVHIALRGTGEVLTIDPTENVAVDRRQACRAPRGMAYDAVNDRVLVACQEGTLVELPAGEGEIVRSTPIAQDLRDVVFAREQLVLTRFRAAELIYLDADRKVVNRVTPPTNELGFAPGVAWRALASPWGGLVVAHQRAFSGVIDVGGDEGSAGFSGDPEGVAGLGGKVPGAGGEPGFEVPSRSGYGAPRQPCSSVVEGTVTFADETGSVQGGPRLNRMVLPVDAAVTTDTLAIVNAGFTDFIGGSTSIGVYSLEDVQAEEPEFCLGERFIDAPADIVAVQFDPVTRQLVAQRREPAEVLVFDASLSFVEAQIPLGGESVFDTGHEIFHADSGTGISCASCHPEGTEDGKVWRFGGFGARRTQPLDVGLEGTAPFHWDAELPTFASLMTQVLQERMAGPIESPPRQAALEQYVYSLPRRVAVRVEDEAARRGKVIFESKDAGCTECHSGPKLTTGESANIGLDQALQIPSLIGVSARAPYMHDGCAETLLDRFDPACGGPRHGHVEDLEPSDLDDLVAYLETL
jgi:hypothetical protein